MPRAVSDCTSLRKSSRLRARRSMLCTTTVSPSRMKDSMASSWGAFDILARRFVGEDLIERHALKLAIDIPWLVSNSSLSHCSHYRSEEHTSELQSLMRISYAVFCL